MKPDEKTLRFFLGANTPQGFVSRFDQLADEEDGWRSMIIKGGPGSGKSTMMKKIAAQLEEDQDDLELIYCSSDVNSLDGVIAPGLKFAVADGTPPHAMVPISIKPYSSGRSRRPRSCSVLWAMRSSSCSP